MNIPNDRKKEKELPTQAKGNPVYEPTREDMPLWCCGRNCGRNSRLTVFGLSIIGMACSTWLCLSPDYFKFVALRNDTFYDASKRQPDPFQFATEAEVGLFKYKILDVWVYEWPTYRERALASKMLENEVRRLQTPTETPTKTPTKNPTKTPTKNPTKTPTKTPTKAPTVSPSAKPSLTPSVAPSIPPTEGPTSSSAPSICRPDLVTGIAVDCNENSENPTDAPSTRPTTVDPNILVREQTFPLGVVHDYENGMDQFDSTFYNAQLGSILGPVFCGLGFVTGLFEYFCCLFKCSWLPTAIFLYLAFMFQMFTLFLFMSDDFCNYAQDCRLGWAGVGTVIATLFYFVSQMLICCTPRPDPWCNFFKPPPKRMKKKSRGQDAAFDDGNYYDDDEYYDEFGHDDYNDDQYGYNDDPYGEGQEGDDYGADQRGMDPVGEEDEFFEGDGQTYDDDGYGDSGGYDDDGQTFGQETYDDGQTYDDGTYGDGTYGDGTYGDETYGEEGTYGEDSRFGQDSARGID